jgi:hypothetical protein
MDMTAAAIIIVRNSLFGMSNLPNSIPLVAEKNELEAGF